jgi:EAL domain-containing protein (putative c-di-GMP-specific phosphodiesterase class I)/ActR/RegA family two-component response regulator
MSETKPLRLLVIDDDPAIAQTISVIARSAGLETEITCAPDEFFRALEARPPDFIALDLVMPQMDGVEVMLKLASFGCRARIIITSGLGSRVMDAAGRSATENGLVIAGILAKPFSAGTLRKLLSVEPKTAPMAPPTVTLAASAGALAMADRDELREALRAGKIVPYYQPKIKCRSGRLSGFEVLARWLDPPRGPVPPDHFIALAEREGLIDLLSEVILESSLKWFGARFTNSDVSLAINLSAITISNAAAARDASPVAGFVEHVTRRCEESGVEPRRVVFELTESSAMRDPAASLNLLTRLRMKGFHLSLDDFGTGYSSMLQLVRLPFSEIKVDRSFVSTALVSEESSAVVRSIVDLGHSLGLTCVAEGVEDARTLSYLNEIGCDLAQGFGIGRPMDSDAVDEWMQSRPWRRGENEH